MDHDQMTLWLSVDPMADKYPSISPYAYCAWDPVKLVDPDGRDIWLVNKNKERYKYFVGMSSDGYDTYISETIKALNKLYKTKTIGSQIFQIASTDLISIEINESEETVLELQLNINSASNDISNKQIVLFNPFLGIQEIETNKILSPAAGLGHEIGHIINYYSNPEEYNSRKSKKRNDGWTDDEEKYNIETWENMIASEWGELSRAGHSLVDPDGNIKFRIVNTTESTETTIKE